MISASQSLPFDDLGSRAVQADFSGGHLSSDGGCLLLRQVDVRLGLCSSLAGCFTDLRNSNLIDHTVAQLLAQRIHAIALGYEDINDHQALRLDPLLAVAAGKVDPTGQSRLHDKSCAMAAPSTLNRFELGNNVSDRYHKISYNPQMIEETLLETSVRSLPKHATQVVLDLDGMGHLIHGMQEGRHFSAYYDNWCYQPLYIVAGDLLLWAQLRTGESDAKEDVVSALKKIIPAVRRRCKKARILVRGDSGFCRQEIMAFCQQEKEVYYVLGFGKNPKLVDLIQSQLMMAAAKRCLTGLDSAREFTQFEYQAQSWDGPRRVIAKAEVTAQGQNPRFVVTNLPAQGFEQEPPLGAQVVYEEVYCARGNMENILKQQVLDLQADRMSTHYMASNQLRLWLASFAYVLIERLRAVGLAGTQLEKATAGTIRVKLLKVATAVKVSVRRVYAQMSSAFVMRDVFAQCLSKLRQWQPG